MNATQQLRSALDALVARGQSWPCHGRLEWISDDLQDRAYAASHCANCPVLDLCAEVARETKANACVWAGLDLTPTANRRSA